MDLDILPLMLVHRRYFYRCNVTMEILLSVSLFYFQGFERSDHYVISKHVSNRSKYQEYDES